MSATLSRQISRFSLGRRIEHQLSMVLMTILFITGFAQKFHEAGWAAWVILKLGGIDNSRLLHRYTGFVFALFVLQHILVAAYGAAIKRWPPTIIIGRKDFRDAFLNLKYYLGLVDTPARCDRYDYRQKFEYWVMVLCGLVMIGTGFMLWFPVTLFQWLPFLPGQLVPASKTAHTSQAALALIVIHIWHIYNAVLSPDVFPLDTSIFTGKISRERMLREHPLELERLKRHAGSPESTPSRSSGTL